MNLTDQDMLRRLGAGESIAAVCQAAGFSRPQFDAWWQTQAAARVPRSDGGRKAGVAHPVRIDRDRWGIPHISAESDADLFFGVGHAMAQDRLFQLDLLRRRGAGRLSEILGPDASDTDLLLRTSGFKNVFELDLLARTVGLSRIAATEWHRLNAETRVALEGFAAGVNAVIEESRDRLPIEFALLDYQPEPWTPLDSLTIEGEFRWYLTGRFPVIVMPELAKRALSEPLYRAFMTSELDDESILPAGTYPKGRVGVQPIGAAAGDPQGATGSNNWVADGKHTVTGKPLLASDPHIAFEAVSCWYEMHVRGGAYHAAGMAYVGMPAVMFGRTPRVAWGCTNNICSQRDLYDEKTDPAHPGCFLFDGKWEPERKLEETIAVKGQASVRKTIRFSRNGPVVNEVLPPPARGLGTVTVRWLGAYEGGWLTALLGMNRAKSAAELREAIRPWRVPTFSVVYADVEGHIGYQSAGRVPVRDVWERGYRPGWDPQHQWKGLIPFEGMPHVIDPARGWMATANNRPAPEDFAYPLSGTWAEGLRHARIREMFEEKTKYAQEDFVRMQQDGVSLRARQCVPHLVKALAGSPHAAAVRQLESWDCRMEPDRVGATIWEIFFAHWTRAVVHDRFDGEVASLLTGGASGLAAALLERDAAGWFGPGARTKTIHAAFGGALDWIQNRLGPDVAGWQWGKIHTLPLRHYLSGRGDLAQLLDHGGIPVKGNSHTVCNTGLGAQFEARSGPGYRLIADLNTSPPGLWAVDGQSESGHPGSPHYRDQLDDWIGGRYHYLPLDAGEVAKHTVTTRNLEPDA
jgi:penicillin amidase